MHRQLQAVIDEFHAASDRLHRLLLTVPPDDWPRRADPDRWSVAECVAHLNLTGEAFVPLLERALAEARALGAPAPRRYRRDPIGWWLWWTGGPPVRIRVRTTARFVPQATAPPAELVAEFERWQLEQVRCAEAADGLPLHRVRVTSPFDARIRYNAYSCLTILPRHQHRHLWQAEQVWTRTPS